MKKIVVITGSPHKNGTTAFMTEQFIGEAGNKGHEVYRFDAAFEDINPCTGCYYCKSNEGQCLFADSMEYLKPKLRAADFVVFVTPLYYFGMSAQLKGVVDRFYSSNNLLSGNKEALLLSACADKEDWVSEGLVTQYKSICQYMKWENKGMILAKGCGTKADIEKTDFLMQVRDLGANV